MLSKNESQVHPVRVPLDDVSDPNDEATESISVSIGSKPVGVMDAVLLEYRLTVIVGAKRRLGILSALIPCVICKNERVCNSTGVTEWGDKFMYEAFYLFRAIC